MARKSSRPRGAQRRDLGSGMGRGATSAHGLIASRKYWRECMPILGLGDLIANKLATGRDKDQVDVKGLEGKA